MNLVIDCGNTRFKVGIFSGTTLEKKYSFSNEEELKDFLQHLTVENAIVSSVSKDSDKILNWIKAQRKSTLTHTLPLPVQVNYKTPHSLGVDRIAAVCGAIDIFEKRDCLVIDAGTCITYDFIDRNKNYWGGAISPGLSMRFKAMNTFTERLPLVSMVGEADLIGDSTESGIRSGVLNGALMEMEGFIKNYRELYPDLGVVLCGGDSSFFENNLKPTIFAAPNLVLSGLNRILLYNAVL